MSSDESVLLNYQVPALDKGLDILECLSARSAALTQAQIARELGRRPTEIFRILTTLERRGYVHRDSLSGAYRLTLRLFELGHTHTPFDELVRFADGPMRELTSQTEQACHLSVIDRNQLLVLHQVESRARVRISVETGSTYSLLRSASGRVLVAARGREYEEELARREALSPELCERLSRRLERIRKRGYETAYSESIQGVTDIAVPIGGTNGRVTAALAIAALPRERGAFLRETIEPMQRAAADIGKAAGLFGGEGT